MTMTTKALLKRDAKRDIGAELLESLRQMKAGRAGKIHQVASSFYTASLGVKHVDVNPQ